MDGPGVYAYGLNSPLAFVDPEGLLTLSPQSKPPTTPSRSQCAKKCPPTGKDPFCDNQLEGKGGACAPKTGGGGNIQPASEATARDIAKTIERDLGKDARRDFHDAKEGRNDRTLDQLKQDARDIYDAAGKTPPSWLKK